MNVHPIFTHFPVALLTLYGIMELARFKKISTQQYWFYVKAIFLILGTVIGYATFFTGYVLRDDYKLDSIVKVINTHMWFAIATLVLFSLLSLGYFIAWLKKEKIISDTSNRKSVRFLLSIKSVLNSDWFCILGALAGLVGITVTGALGGALAYGNDVDPMVNFVYNLLIK